MKIELADWEWDIIRNSLEWVSSDKAADTLAEFDGLSDLVDKLDRLLS